MLIVVCLCCSLWTPELTFGSTPSFGRALTFSGLRKYIKATSHCQDFFSAIISNEVSGTLFINIWEFINCCLPYSFINRLVLVFYS